jgi:hypothetical protein
VQTQGVPLNDDFQARMPARYSGGVPAIEVLTQPASPIQEYTSPNAEGGLDVYWNLSGWNPYRVHFLRSRVFAQSR